MSGYNQKTGVFELTATKADYWFRRTVLPEGFNSDNKGMRFYADLFEFFGHTVTHVGSAFLRVKATPAQVWSVLSGQKSDPKRAAHYYR